MTEELKEKPNLEGERYLLSAPEPEVFEWDTYKYSIKPLDMVTRREWARISQERYRLESEWWKEQGIDNPYLEAGAILDGVEDDVKISDLDKEIQVKYLACIENIDRGRSYAFSKINLLPLFTLMTKNITLVERDGYTGPITIDYLQYRCTWEEIVFLSEKIDTVSTLSKAEVLGLR